MSETANKLGGRGPNIKSFMMGGLSHNFLSGISQG